MSDDRTVWYRKWRPQTFREITGQEHVTRTLRNAVAVGRTAHAYLLCGPRGTGKTTTARVLAKAVNCAAPVDGEPCDRCESCVAVREGRALDLVEMDAASNRGIDDIRELRDRVGYAASGGRFKVYLIDEVHELTQQAFDALLKTLEEPPAHVIFVLATTDAHRVPATIVSRCQRFDLTRARLADVVARLTEIAAAESVEVEDAALQAVARAATGSFRDAVNLLEQLVASYGATLTLEQVHAGLGLTGDARAVDLARAAVQGDLGGGLSLIARVRDDGVDLRRFNREVVAALRSLLLLTSGAPTDDLDAETRAALQALATDLDVARVARALRAFGTADFRGEPQASLPIELALADLCLRSTSAEPVAPLAQAASPVRAAASPGGARASSRTALPPGTATEQRSAPAAAPAQPDITARLKERLAARDGQGEPVHHDEPELSPPPPPELEAGVRSEAAEAAASEPVEADQPVAIDAPLSLEAARARYRDIYTRMQRLNRLAPTRINGGDIVAIDDATVTFGLPFPLQAEKLAEGTEHHRVLAQAVAASFGRPYAVHCVHMPDVQDRLRSQQTKTSHLVDEALKHGAQLLSSPPGG